MVLSSLKRVARARLTKRWDVPSVGLALERLRENGISPQHIFDVGAYRGEFAQLCLKLWPDSLVTCFEVLPEPGQEIIAMMKKHHGIKLINCLLGSANRNEVELHLAETASSVLTEQAHPQPRSAAFPMRTVDDVVTRDFDGESPDFLKLDVQGYELEVLKGAVKALSQLKVILAEVNFLDIHTDAPLLAELVSWLDEHEFVAYDICSLIRRPLDRALWQADMIFVPASSPLRSNKQYA